MYIASFDGHIKTEAFFYPVLMIRHGFDRTSILVIFAPQLTLEQTHSAQVIIDSLGQFITCSTTNACTTTRRVPYDLLSHLPVNRQ